MAKTRKKQHCYDYPRPALTADIVLVTQENRPRVLLIQRKEDPFAGSWALPGGFLNENEDPAEAARRELEEETGIKGLALVQLQAFGKPGRDPRGWTVTIAFLARVDADQVHAVAADDAAAVAWHRLDQLPPLAFDHAEILEVARQGLNRD